MRYPHGGGIPGDQLETRVAGPYSSALRMFVEDGIHIFRKRRLKSSIPYNFGQ